MKGFYSIWTGPSKKEFYMQDFEILTMVLSALEWRKHNGSVKMYADQKAYDYLIKYDLLQFFNDGYELLEVDEDINPRVYWAAGKLYALRQLTEPRAMIDLDLIVWKNMDQEIAKGDIMVIHREDVHNHIYPDKDFFQMKKDYCFPAKLNWDAKACNTALLIIKDMEFLKKYVDTSIDFMKQTAEENENLCHMVFAEQRLLGALAEYEENGCYLKKIYSAFPLAQDIGLQDSYTHVWGHKNILKFNYEERAKYCRKCLRRLKDEFPGSYKKMIKLDELKEYLDL